MSYNNDLSVLEYIFEVNESNGHICKRVFLTNIW